jgi:predicted aminopeptidase
LLFPQAHRSIEAARQNAEKLAAKLREEDALRAALADAEEHKKVF